MHESSGEGKHKYALRGRIQKLALRNGRMEREGREEVESDGVGMMESLRGRTTQSVGSLSQEVND